MSKMTSQYDESKLNKNSKDRDGTFTGSWGMLQRSQNTKAGNPVK